MAWAEEGRRHPHSAAIASSSNAGGSQRDARAYRAHVLRFVGGCACRACTSREDRRVACACGWGGQEGGSRLAEAAGGCVPRMLIRAVGSTHYEA